MARDYYVLDFLTPDVDVSPIVPALRGFFDDVLSLSVQELNFRTIVDGLGALYYDYPFTGGRRFVSTGSPVVLVDSVAPVRLLLIQSLTVTLLTGLLPRGDAAALDPH